MGSRLEENSITVRKAIEKHTFTSESGDEYEASAFGGFADYFRRKKIKLQNLDSEIRANSDEPPIFKSIVCHVNGYTQPSLNDLHAMIVRHGGGFMQYLDGKTMCTHIIASNLTPKKREEFRRYRIVKPSWIVESIKEGKLLPWNDFRLIDEAAGQRFIGVQNGAITSQKFTKTQSYKHESDRSWYNHQLRVQEPPDVSNDAQSKDPCDDFANCYSDQEPTNVIEKTALSPENLLTDLRNSSPPCTPRELLEVNTKVEAAPLSKTLPEFHDDNGFGLEESAESRDKSEYQDSGHLCSQVAHNLTTENRHRVSREPELDESGGEDVCHAIVRDSEIFRGVSPSKLARMSAEEHNALLLSDPKIRKSTVVHPDFLEQYYRESRLHHLSTWKADLKSQLQALTAEKSASRKAKNTARRITGQRRYVMHIDFDSFFAAVSLKKYPQYADKPCVVAHGGGSGSEIASCNYPARKFGISNGMWMKRAQDLCPDLKVLPYDFPAYEEASRCFYDAILATDGLVQSVSIDEALVDISATCITCGGSDGVQKNDAAVIREQSKADEISVNLRSEILRQTGCNVSVGIGGNILLAKLALRKAKPAGQYQLSSEDVLDFIGGLQVKSLPGVAWSISGKLEEIGIKLVKDIREVTKERLVQTLGPKTGEKIWEYARGIDQTEVGDQIIRKSVSAEVNWGVRFENQGQVDEFMQGLCGELHKRLVKEGVKGTQLTIKIMRRAIEAPRDPPKHLGHGKCDTFNKSTHLGMATNETATIAKEAILMLKSFRISPGELRGIGIQMQKLNPVKVKPDGQISEGSQRRLPFKAAEIPTQDESGKQMDSVHDGLQIPSAPRILNTVEPNVSAEPANSGKATGQPLDTQGTQFLMPTQADLSALAELPQEVRAKLTKRAQNHCDVPTSPKNANGSSGIPGPPPRAQSPAFTVPTQSQLDPDILDALPAEVRDEILGFYKSPQKTLSGQAILPQSPRKIRTLPSSKPLSKRKRGSGPLFGKSKVQGFTGINPTLTQANFVTRPALRHLRENDGEGIATDTKRNEVDKTFLDALPEDLRAEVADQQRQARLQQTGGIDLSLHQRPRALQHKKAQQQQGGESPSDPVLHLALRPDKPTFTARGLTTLADLREAVRAWYREFSDECPYEEDVEVLARYLYQVVHDEGDMAKAIAIVDWLKWLVATNDVCSEQIRSNWEHAVHVIEKGMQKAAEDRCLGKLDFG